MYADLYDNLSINVKLRSVFGLNTAVYWAILRFISKRVVAKEKFDQDGFFQLDRQYVEKYTTLTEEDQRECEAVLSEAGIVEVKDKNCLRVDAEKRTGLIIGASASQLKTIKSRVSRLTKDQRKEAKLAGMAKQIKTAVTESNEDLKMAYYNYIDTIVHVKHINKAIMTTIINELNDYSDNPNTKKIIIELMMSAGYTVTAYGIQLYEREYKRGGLAVSKNINKKVKVSTDQVF